MNERWCKALASVAVLLCLAACSEPSKTASDSPGEAAEVEVIEFTLPDLNGDPIHLADFRGKTVVIDFWATWCPPCEFQVPELNKFWTAHADRDDVMVIGVAVDVEGAEVVAPWAEKHGIIYQLVIGDEGVARDFGAMGFPTLVIVRPDGAIDSRHMGLIEVDELESLVAEIQTRGNT